jgi:addiction module HigA family antidote
MAIPNISGMQRKPTHPGEMLREDFLPDYDLTVAGLAESLGVSRQSVNELLRERRAVSPEMALRLARLFGNSPEFWLNAQELLICGLHLNQSKRKLTGLSRYMLHNQDMHRMPKPPLRFGFVTGDGER